jgi:hypothetical protein
VDLPLGEFVAGDEGEPRGHHAAGKKLAELFDGAGAETQRDQVQLVGAGVAAEGDGGQKLLQRFVLFSLDHLFYVLGFLQAEVVIEAAAHGFVEREFEGFIVDWAGSYAAEKRVCGGGWVGRLRVKARSRAA